MNYSMLIKYIIAIRKRVWMVALIVLFAVTTSFLMTRYTVAPEFSASTKMIINVKPTTNQEFVLNEIMAYSKLTKTYNEVLKSNAVAQDVIDKMKLHLSPAALTSMIAVATNTDSQIITVTVTNTDPKIVAQLADEVSLAFMDKVAHMMQVDNVVILDRAIDRPIAQTKPNMKLNVLAAFMLSAGAGIGALVLREYLDPTIKTREEVRVGLGMPLVGEIGIWESKAKKKLPFGLGAGEAAASESGQPLPTKQHRLIMENYHTLYRNLIPLNVLHEVKTIHVTSTVRGEGKTTMLSRFGVLLAQTGQRVLLIDADLEHPNLHDVFQTPNERGLCACLTGDLTLAEAVQESHVLGLDVLTTGQITQPAVRGIGGAPLKALLQEARDAYDIVLIDSSAMDDSLLPQLIAPAADGVLFVVGSGIVNKKHAVQASDVLYTTEANVLGAILNNMEGKTSRPSFFLDRQKTT